ncbi:peptidylprolyl isomerase [Mangrovibacterium diazotrophicum]|uniref:Periplasmic chaperone PpiD n=1 Tax=Mangrovibacterium diazotrophicum TaxID=1261403 RepID=A0A419VVI1_9BACT|nr:peptidylprolyl isomerase [Mangrovibacterium diazotrophicum]RKD86066.1 peptidyl-prolyl cis-trans isomerase D [Mangrovibacterium diazotrophicum]
MATLQRIRNRAGILVAIIIGLALVAFILGDILNASNSLLRPNQLKIAEINGESVQYPDFQKKVEETAEIYKMNTGQTQLNDNAWAQIREQVWQQYVREAVMGDVYEDLGLAVSGDELFDMVQGSNLHPVIQQLFTNPNTGQVDRTAVLQFLKAINSGQATAQQKAYWLYIEDQIKEERIQTKYNNLVRQGLYVTSAEAKESLNEKNKNVNIEFVSLPYASISDSAVSVNEKDLQAYYDEHKETYKQDATRTIEYLVFPVAATEEDDANTLKWIEDVKPEFETIQDNAQYVNVNSDVRFQNVYEKQDEMPENIADFAFSGNVGDVFGPFKENNAYKLVKIDDIKNLPDSVEARHILIKPETTGSYDAALALADSLKNLVEKGESFAKLAGIYSEDPGSAAKGGDLGWFKKNQMVKPFEEAAFNGDVNKLYVTTTQFGVHLIQPTKKGKEVKQVRLAELIRNIEPSTKTYQTVYGKASKFASENTSGSAFDEAAKTEGLSKRVARVSENDRQVVGLDQSRNMIRAAYTADVNDILVNNEGSTIFEFGDNFVIAKLASVQPEGYAPLNEVAPTIKLAVLKEKKGEALVAKMKEAASSDDIDAIASTLGTEVKSAANIHFDLYSVPVIGVEPAVVGTVVSMEQGKISAPIKGNNGVYITKVVAINELNNTNAEAEKARLEQSLAYRANYQAYEAQRSAAEIDDRRAKFY